MENPMSRVISTLVLAAAVVCVSSAASAQTQSVASETKTFEVLAVDGNRLVVRLPEGTRELTVADDFRFNVNGKQLAVRELSAGMKGTATITTKTTVTPVTVTEVKNGTVAYSAGSTIIVRTDEGVRSFTQGEVDKRGVKIMRAGKPAQVSDFRQGDKLSATIITSLPPKVMTEQEVQATLATSGGAAAGGAAAGGSGSGALASTANSGSGAGTPAAAKKTLPKTASSTPLLGLASILLVAMGLGLTFRRRLVS